jgi:hypothetical protein
MARKKKKKSPYYAVALFDACGHLFKSPIVLSWVLVISGLIALTAMSVPKLRATQISADDLKVTFHDPPVWLDDSLLLELQDVARINLARTTVGREGLMQTAEALGATGWFTDVKQVQWLNDTEAIVHATYLIPYAKVQDNNETVFIDVHGRRLPTRVGAIVKQKYHFITLKEPKYERPMRPGLQWNGGDIMAGLDVLKLIYNKPWATQVQHINLARWTSNGTLILETNTPSFFIWGSSPGKEHGLEALADHKIDRLNHIFTKYGRIDQGIEAEFDLTNTSAVIRN